MKARMDLIQEKPTERIKEYNGQRRSMTGAIKAVVKGSSISGAAREHGVPRTTLQDRVLGKVTHGTKQPISVALSLK